MLPTVHIEDFVALKKDQRERVNCYLDAFGAIGKAANRSAEIDRMAEVYGHMRGFSAPSLRRKFYAFARAGGDWRVCIDHARLPAESPRKMAEKCYKKYCENNQRSSREAYRKMMRDFRAGRELEPAGITWKDVWKAAHPKKAAPQFCPQDWTPRGWSYRNLQHAAGLSKYEKTAARIGAAAAREHLPAVYTTRAGLAVGQIYMFDDMWHDILVQFPGQEKAVRPLEFACIDVFSACKFQYGMKPRRTEDGKRTNLNEREMRFLLAHILCNVGYNAETGCTLVVEHGTAAIRPELERRLKDLSHGKISVSRSGILGEQVHKGMFPGRGGGNFKAKAALESSHALAHTAAAHLPGQTGANSRTNRPEQLAGMQKYDNELQRAAARMTPARAAALMRPFLSYYDYADAIGELYDNINWRTWHALEGWEQARLTATEWRLTEDSPWQPIDSLDTLAPAQRQIADGLLMENPALRRVRKLSPMEVWQAGAENLARLDKFAAPLILGADTGKLKKVRDDGLIAFRDRDCGPDEHRYLARVTTPDGFQQALRPGRKYLMQVNPFCPGEAFVTDPESGGCIGVARRWETACKADMDAVHRLMGAQAHEEKLRNEPVRERHAGEAAERLAMIEHNRRIVSGEENCDAREIAASRRAAQTPGDLDDIYDFAAVQSGEQDSSDDANWDGMSEIY